MNGRGCWRAVAYLAAPYQMLAVYVRGNLPEMMALALLPWNMVVLLPAGDAWWACQLYCCFLFSSGFAANPQYLFIALCAALACLFGIFGLAANSPGKTLAPLAAGGRCIVYRPLDDKPLPGCRPLAEKDSVQTLFGPLVARQRFPSELYQLERTALSPRGSATPACSICPSQCRLAWPCWCWRWLALIGMWFFGTKSQETQLPDQRKSAKWRSLWRWRPAFLLLFTLPTMTIVWETLPLIRFVPISLATGGKSDLATGAAGRCHASLDRLPCESGDVMAGGRRDHCCGSHSHPDGDTVALPGRLLFSNRSHDLPT